MFIEELKEMLNVFSEITPKDVFTGFAIGAGLYSTMLVMCKVIVLMA